MRQTKSSTIGQAEKGLLIMPQLNGKLCLPVFFFAVFSLREDYDIMGKNLITKGGSL